MAGKDLHRDNPDIEGGNEELLERFVAGDRQAFAEIMKRYRSRALNFAYRYLGNFEEAEDAAQDCFVKTYRNRQYYDKSREFDPWFYQILANCCRDRIRKKSRLSALLERFKFEQETEAVEIKSDHERRRPELFDEALQKLSPARREILLLRFDEDLSYEEIAETLGISLGTVMSRLHRAKKELAKALRAKGMNLP